MMRGDHAFTKWFNGRAHEGHGVDLNVRPAGPPSELVVDTDRVGSPVG